MLYAPSGLPDPNNYAFTEAVVEAAFPVLPDGDPHRDITLSHCEASAAQSRCATPARSSSSSASVLSMRSRLKSSMARPSTRVYSPFAQVTGTP